MTNSALAMRAWVLMSANIFACTSTEQAIIGPEGTFLRSEPQVAARKSRVTADAQIAEVVSQLLSTEDMLPISDICAKLRIDSMGCSRVQAYLGETLGKLTSPLQIKHKINRDSFQIYSGDVTTKNGLLHSNIDKGHNPTFTEFGDLFRYIPDGFASDLPFLLAGEDMSWLAEFMYPTFVRPAPVPDAVGNHVIVRLMRHRYEDPVEKVPKVDIPFQQKKDMLLWRGSTTGQLKPCASGQFAKRSRMLLVQKYSSTKDSRIDVGFSKAIPAAQVQSGWMKHNMSIAAQLTYKFLLVVDGNSEGSGMEWIMSSNSVPVMPKPVVQTWALHSWLQPWKHFIPVEPDFSDLSTQLDWALANPDKAAQIAQEGKNFMQEFADKDRENRIHAAVLAAYLNRMKVEDAPSETGSISTGPTSSQDFC